MRHIRKFLQSEDGPTAVEYAVLLALIVMACIVSVRTLGTTTFNSFTNTNNQINSAIGS